uniref:Uncharacterized protein n=1 Tax=Schizaphis graminum TaxID=13262 RepID=A0A2S2NQB7_SCHGA
MPGIVNRLQVAALPSSSSKLYILQPHLQSPSTFNTDDWRPEKPTPTDSNHQADQRDIRDQKQPINSSRGTTTIEPVSTDSTTLTSRNDDWNHRTERRTAKHTTTTINPVFLLTGHLLKYRRPELLSAK